MDQKRAPVIRTRKTGECRHERRNSIMDAVSGVLERPPVKHGQVSITLNYKDGNLCNAQIRHQDCTEIF